MKTIRFCRQLSLAGLLSLLLLIAVGCSSGKVVTITTVPPDASVFIDGEPRPRGPVTERFGLGRTVLVSRLGYKDERLFVDSNSEQSEIIVRLKPESRSVRFIVTPLPAIVKVDGIPIAESAVTQASAVLEFSVDNANLWVPHVVTAERPGYRRTERLVRFTDTDAVYTLPLEPERKTVVIRTDPPGAEVFVDGTSFGPSPATLENLVITTDPQTNEWVGRRVRAVKAGLEPAERVISWDDNQTEYLLKLGNRSKTARVRVEPLNAIVYLGGKVLPRRPDGVVEVPLEFAPVNAGGDLPIHELSIAPPAHSKQYEPATLKIGWDAGKLEYSVSLASVTPPVNTASRPAVTQPVVAAPPKPETPPVKPPVTTPTTTAVVPLPATKPIAKPPSLPKGLPVVSAVWQSIKNPPAFEADQLEVQLIPLTTEPDGRKPTPVVKASKGITLDDVVTSPDGATLAWSVISVKSGQPKSQIFIRNTAASAQPTAITQGEFVDLMPSFSPDGQRVIFTSDRMGDGRTASYDVMISPIGPAVRATPGESKEAELSPTLDSSPKATMFVETRKPDGSPPRLVAIDFLTGKRTDLGAIGEQPRVSPRADSIVFVRPHPTTGKRDLWLLKFGQPEPINLTNTPDDDDFDPAWSKTGSRLAFASNRPAGSPPNLLARREVNLWVLRVSRPADLLQVTDNDAVDDNPAWSGDDAALFFRSSRGSEWGIWKIELPERKQ